MDPKDLSKLLNVKIDEVDGEDRTLRFIASTDIKDRDGEIIEAGAFKLKNFKRNPVFLLAHNYREFPIGKIVDIEQDGGKFKIDVNFPTREDYPIADTAYRLYKGGFMNAVSVGFRPNFDKMDIIDGVRHFKEAELLEVSAVSVPANPEAVMMRMFDAEKKGAVNRQEIMELSLAAKSFFSTMKNVTPPKAINENEKVPPFSPEIKEGFVKSGRVLSKANEKLLRDALETVGKATETITKVLDKVATPEPVPEEPKTVKYPSMGIYNDLLSGKAGSKSGKAELIDPTLMEQVKGLNKKEKKE